ncbi:hypothetical protein JCM10213_003349 [Rhodosporidiobolus nylandii]
MDAAAIQAVVLTTVGPVLVASCLSCWTCGICVSLAGTYWSRYRTDRLWIRCAVIFATLWALLDTAVNCSWAYKWSVTNYANPAGLAAMPWELTAYCFIMSTAVLLVQSFFLWRLYVVSKNWMLAGALLAISFGCYAIALYMGYFCSVHDQVAAFADISSVSWGWFGGVLGVDLVITVSMSYYLIVRPRRLTGSSATSSPIRGIVVKAAQTNALSAVCQIAIVVLYARYPTALHYTYGGLIEVKIYIGSFIATLNARSPHADGNFDTTLSGDGRTRGLGAQSLGGQPVHVSVRQEIAIDADEEDSISGGTRGEKSAFPSSGTIASAAASPYHVQFAGSNVEKSGKGHEMSVY